LPLAEAATALSFKLRARLTFHGHSWFSKNCNENEVDVGNTRTIAGRSRARLTGLNAVVVGVPEIVERGFDVAGYADRNNGA
jgi:hypothetical protein